MTRDVAMISKDRNRRKKAIIKDKWFNYHRIWYFGKNYTILDFRPLKKKVEDIPNYYQKTKNHTLIITEVDDDSEFKLFKSDKVNMVKTTNIYTLKRV